jgi:hypothetical protein
MARSTARASSPRSSRRGDAIAATGARLFYLPPYSPDLNPIEQAFAKLKALLRTAAARTVQALRHTIGQLLEAFTPIECAHDLAHAGYVPSNRETLQGPIRGAAHQRLLPDAALVLTFQQVEASPVAPGRSARRRGKHR